MIIELIDKYLVQRVRGERQINCFPPSCLHLGPKALLKHYFGEDQNQEYDPRILRIFDNGNHVHDRIQTYLEDMGILKEREFPVSSKEYEIEGTCDGIVQLNGQEGVLEIKSINAAGFHTMYEPLDYHLIQANIYMFCSGIPRCCLLYECKDDQSMLEFYIQQDPAILDPVLDKIKKVQQWIREGGQDSGEAETEQETG